MNEYDLFDLLGIGFDPPEVLAKRVSQKLEQKTAELGRAMALETRMDKRYELRARKEYLEGVALTILSENGEKINTAALKELAAKKTEKEKKDLRAILSLMALNGKKTATEGMLREFRKTTGLSLDHIREAFESEGFQILGVNELEAFPKFPSNAERIDSELAAVRKIKDPRPNGADTSLAVDLYGFAAYVANDGRSADAFRAMSTAELSAFFDEASKRFSRRNDDLGKFCGSIAFSAKVYVFHSEDSRKAYAEYLLYHAEELTALFDLLKKVPPSIRESREFAESCISKICEYFPDRGTALAIYIREIGVYYLPWM